MNNSVAIQTPNYRSPFDHTSYSDYNSYFDYNRFYEYDYNETQACTWTITAPEDARLRITFDDFATEFQDDGVKICNSPHCNEFTGLHRLRRQAPCLISHESTSNVLTIDLSTGRTTEFSATVTAFEDI